MRYLVSATLALALLAAAAAAPAAEKNAEKKPPAKGKIRVLLTFGGHGFEKEPFFALFDSIPNVRCTKAEFPIKGKLPKKAEFPNAAELLKPGLEKDFDVIVMYDMVPSITPKQQKAFVALLKERGIGLVSLHHNMGAHSDWDLFRKIIGGKFFLEPTEIDGKKYPKSGWAHGKQLEVTVADKKHPITRGLQDFEIHDEVYNNYYTAPNVRVLLTTDHPQNDPELAWVTKFGKSPVFYLMLGHDNEAYKNPSFRETVARGIRWAAGR